MHTKRNDIISILTNVVIHARTGDYCTLSSQLNHVLQLIQNDLSTGSFGAGDLKTLMYSLETMNAMQQTQNWVAFADILEFEFIPHWIAFHH